MNWEAIGAIGEILGAGAVIVTLVYLAVQIRHVREQNQSNALDHIIESLNDFAGRIAESDSLASIVSRGRASYGALSEGEKLRFDMIHYYFLNNLESWYLQGHQIFGSTREQNIGNIRSNIAAFCDNPGFREFWQSGKALYPHLAKVVDEYFANNELASRT
jgi:hypothetical protein